MKYVGGSEMDPLLKLVLNPPPISTTILYPGFETDAIKIIRAKGNARSKFEEAECDLGIVSEELKLFSKILYKNHNRFRNDNGYKDLRMLEKSLQKFSNHKFLKGLQISSDSFLTPPSAHLKTYLPNFAIGIHTELQLYGAAAFLPGLRC